MCVRAMEERWRVDFGVSCIEAYLQHHRVIYNCLFWKSIGQIFRRIFIALDSLTSQGANVKLQWIPGHREITGNEAAGRKTKEIADFIRPLKEPRIRYFTAVVSLLKSQLKEAWESRWSKRIKRAIYAPINPTPTSAARTL